MDERQRALTNLDVTRVIAKADAAPLDGVEMLDAASICGVRSAPLETFAGPELDPDHPFICRQSSGTTGVPKTLFWSHRQFIHWVERIRRDAGIVPDARILSTVRMYFTMGRDPGLAVLQVGGTVLVEHHGSVEAYAGLLRDRRITTTHATPVHLRALLRYAEGREPLLPGLRPLLCTTAAITPQERLLARKRLTEHFVESYGTIETGVLAIAEPADQDAQPESVGRLAHRVEAKVVDPDGQPVPAGEVGIIGFRVPGLAKEYVKNPEATAHQFRDGWFYPGDLAALNEEGYVFFKGRADDVINCEGTKFYPGEVESILLAHPQVTEAAVFGWPHPRIGAVPVAYVVSSSPVAPKELVSFCRERAAPFKAPYEIVFLEELPRNPMGKVLKSELKEHHKKRAEERARKRYVKS